MDTKDVSMIPECGDLTVLKKFKTVVGLKQLRKALGLLDSIKDPELGQPGRGVGKAFHRVDHALMAAAALHKVGVFAVKLLGDIGGGQFYDLHAVDRVHYAGGGSRQFKAEHTGLA